MDTQDYGRIFTDGKISYWCWISFDFAGVDGSVKVSIRETARGYFLSSG